MLCTARGGIASAFHRNVAANIQRKIERAKRKGEKTFKPFKLPKPFKLSTPFN